MKLVFLASKCSKIHLGKLHCSSVPLTGDRQGGNRTGWERRE